MGPIKRWTSPISKQPDRDAPQARPIKGVCRPRLRAPAVITGSSPTRRRPPTSPSVASATKPIISRKSKCFRARSAGSRSSLKAPPAGAASSASSRMVELGAQGKSPNSTRVRLRLIQNRCAGGRGEIGSPSVPADDVPAAHPAHRPRSHSSTRDIRRGAGAGNEPAHRNLQTPACPHDGAILSPDQARGKASQG